MKNAVRTALATSGVETKAILDQTLVLSGKDETIDSMWLKDHTQALALFKIRAARQEGRWNACLAF